jgi:hypothetical protein
LLDLFFDFRKQVVSQLDKVLLQIRWVAVEKPFLAVCWTFIRQRVTFQWAYKEEPAYFGSDVLPRIRALHSNVTQSKQKE